MARRKNTSWQPEDYMPSPHLFERRLSAAQEYLSLIHISEPTRPY